MVKLLLAAILVVLILATIPVVRVPETAKPVIKSQQIDSFHTALDAFKQDTGRYPTEAEGLEALRHGKNIKGWQGPYLPQDIPTDPWNTPYRYTLYPSNFPIVR